MIRTKIVMVMGFRHSSTNALFDRLAASRGILAFNEYADDQIYRNFCLRPEREIRNQKIFATAKRPGLKRNSLSLTHLVS